MTYNYHIISPKIDLSNHNYISKNTVYISNIPEEIYHKDILYQKKFLGQYGHINQIINKKKKKKEKNSKNLLKNDNISEENNDNTKNKKGKIGLGSNFMFFLAISNF